jgi:hypothetical protein
VTAREGERTGQADSAPQRLLRAHSPDVVGKYRAERDADGTKNVGCEMQRGERHAVPGVRVPQGPVARAEDVAGPDAQGEEAGEGVVEWAAQLRQRGGAGCRPREKKQGEGKTARIHAGL